MKEGGLDGLPHLQYTNFQGLSDKKSVIVSLSSLSIPWIRERLKQCQSSKDSLTTWFLDAVLIGKKVEVGKIVLVVYITWVVIMKKHLPFCREFSILWIEDRVVVEHVI